MSFEVGEQVERNDGPWHRTGTVTRRYALPGYPELYEVTWHTQAGRELDPPLVCRGYLAHGLDLVDGNQPTLL